ncbi:Ribonuclease P protein component 4 [uncultured archaeon]|nr:Ribonuclease P protein component 4 [uncultured archaeon]
MKTDPKLHALILERIGRLMGLAEENQRKNPSRAKRYVALAGRMSTRYRVRMPERFKKRICKVCSRYWIPGYNVTVRLNRRNRTVEYRCECGALRRFGYTEKKK